MPDQIVKRERNKMKTYGPWTFDPKNLTLTHEEMDYEIDLERCRTSAALLDWIFQIQSKTWNTPDTMAGLLEAIEEIIDPQANLCSNGIDRGVIDIRKVAKESALGGAKFK